MTTFKEFFEAMEVQTDTEDLSSEDLIKRATQLRKQATLKASGREDQAKKQSLRALQMKQRAATDPREKADLGRRIKELTTTSPEEEVV